MKYRQWAVAPPRPQARAALEAAGLPPLLAGILAARGIDTPEAAHLLLSPESEPLLDPMGLRDMDRAVARIRLALERGEKTAVYGDYDVDGITSTTLLTLTILPTAMLQLRSRMPRCPLRQWLLGGMGAFTACMVICRAFSGVHWFADIVGGILLSAGLVMLYSFLTTQNDT